MVIEKLIRKLKRDPNYQWKSSHSTRDILVIGSGRLIQILRGLGCRLFLKSSKGLLFVGKNVTIKHRHMITAGQNLIIDDNTYVNALSYDGIIFKDNVSVARNCTLLCTGVIAQKGQGIVIGNNTGINSYTFIAGQGGITIGDNVIIGPGTKIFSENHNFGDFDLIIKDQGVTREGVVIHNNVWIGANAVILAGVTIGEGCVIAAGSVVTHNIPDNCVAAGTPAKVIKNRINILSTAKAS